jgi:hypothetical protein
MISSAAMEMWIGPIFMDSAYPSSRPPDTLYPPCRTGAAE